MNKEFIYEHTQNEELRGLLIQFFNARGWQGAKLKLSRLKKMAKDEQEQIDMVNKSMKSGWKAFYQKSEVNK